MADKMKLTVVDKATENFINEKHYDEFCVYLGSIMSRIQSGDLLEDEYLKRKVEPVTKFK